MKFSGRLHATERFAFKKEQRYPLNRRQSGPESWSAPFTNSTKHVPSRKRNRFAACQDIARILWNPNVHYRIHKSPPPVHIPSQINADHSPHSTSVLILYSRLRLGLPSGRFPSSFPTKPLYSHLCFLMHATFPGRFTEKTNFLPPPRFEP